MIRLETLICVTIFNLRTPHVENKLSWKHRHLSIIDCLSFVMCPLLAPLVIVFFSFFVAVVYSTNEANKAGGTHH